MKNRIPRYPGRIKLTPIDAANGIYDLTRADEPEVVGTPLAKKLLDYAVAACGVTAGTSTAYTLDGELVDGFTLTDGAKVNFKLHTASGANATLNVGGTGAKPIQSFFGSGITLPAGVWITAVYSADKDAFLTASDANTTTRIAIFTTSQSVTIPENIYGPAHVLMFGGGGGMGGHKSAGGYVNYAGGGGGYLEEFDAGLTPGETYEIIIGAGGAKGADGGATIFAGHTAAGGKTPSVKTGVLEGSGGDGGSGGGAGSIFTTCAGGAGGNAQYGGGGGSASRSEAVPGGNGGTYGGGGGSARGGTPGAGGEYGGDGGNSVAPFTNGEAGTTIGNFTVFPAWFLLLQQYFGAADSNTGAADGGVTYTTYGHASGGGGGYGGKGGNSGNSNNTAYIIGGGGGGGMGCKGGNGSITSNGLGGGGGGGGYGDDGSDGSGGRGGGGGGFFGIAARGGGGTQSDSGQSGCVCIIYRTMEV